MYEMKFTITSNQLFDPKNNGRLQKYLDEWFELIYNPVVGRYTVEYKRPLSVVAYDLWRLNLHSARDKNGIVKDIYKWMSGNNGDNFKCWLQFKDGDYILIVETPWVAVNGTREQVMKTKEQQEIEQLRERVAQLEKENQIHKLGLIEVKDMDTHDICVGGFGPEMRLFVGRETALSTNGVVASTNVQRICNEYTNVRQLSAEERKKFFKAGFSALGISE